MIRVLLVDDDALVRSGLRIMLAGAANVDVVAEAADGHEVLGAVDLHRPDVVLMDIRMPQLDGIATTRLLATQPDPPAIVVLTTFDADELVLRALQAGAAGFLLKDTPPAEIVRAIELVHAGDGMLSPAVTRRLISLVARDSDAAARTSDARASRTSPWPSPAARPTPRSPQLCTSPSRRSRPTSPACSTSSTSTTASRSPCS
jgi:DNA-binding NarL/FixJ family response regulator